MRSSRRNSPSAPGSPGCAKRGACRAAVAKLRLPRPPRPPLLRTNCWPCLVRSAIKSHFSCERTAVRAVLGNEPRLIILRDEVVQVGVGLQNHVAAVPAVAAGRAALGPGRFTEEGDATFPAVTGARENFDFVNKHRAKVAPEVRRGK